jgi:hypothetical protein
MQRKAANATTHGNEAGSENWAAPLGARYEVAGRRRRHRSGSGGPPVVFLPGAGLVGLDFLNVQDQVLACTTSVLYDRAGTGWSDEVPLPRSAGEVAGELRAPTGRKRSAGRSSTTTSARCGRPCRSGRVTEIETEFREGGDMPDVPVIVLASMGIDPFMAALMPEAQLRELNSQKAALYRPPVESVPRGEYRAVEGAGHSTLQPSRRRRPGHPRPARPGGRQ